MLCCLNATQVFQQMHPMVLSATQKCTNSTLGARALCFELNVTLVQPRSIKSDPLTRFLTIIHGCPFVGMIVDTTGVCGSRFGFHAWQQNRSRSLQSTLDPRQVSAEEHTTLSSTSQILTFSSLTLLTTQRMWTSERSELQCGQSQVASDN